MSQLTLQQSVVMKEDVLVQDLGGEMVLLNLDTEEYFGLDDVGSVIWATLEEAKSLQVAYERLLERYDVDPAQLQADLLELVEKFVDHGLVGITVT